MEINREREQPGWKRPNGEGLGLYRRAGASTMLLVKVPPRDRCMLLPSFSYSSRMHLPRAKIRRVIRDDRAYRRKIVRCFPIRETCESLTRLFTPWNEYIKRVLTKVHIKAWKEYVSFIYNLDYIVFKQSFIIFK